MGIRKDNSDALDALIALYRRNCTAADVDFTLLVNAPSYPKGSSGDFLVRSVREASGSSLIELHDDGRSWTSSIRASFPDEFLGPDARPCGLNFVCPGDGAFVAVSLLEDLAREGVRVDSFRLAGLSYMERFYAELVPAMLASGNLRCFTPDCKFESLQMNGNTLRGILAEKRPVLVSDEGRKRPVTIRFETFYPDWVSSGSSAVEAMEAGLDIPVSSVTYGKHPELRRYSEECMPVMGSMVNERSLFNALSYSDGKSVHEIISALYDRNRENALEAVDNLAASLFFDNEFCKGQSERDMIQAGKKVLLMPGEGDCHLFLDSDNGVFIGRNGRSEAVEVVLSEKDRPVVCVGGRPVFEFSRSLDLGKTDSVAVKTGGLVRKLKAGKSGGVKW